MAADKARYEMLASNDQGRWSTADEYRMKSLEANERAASPIESVRSDRKSIDWTLSKPKPETLPLDRFIDLCIRQSNFIKGLALTIISGLPFAIFLLVTSIAIPNKTTANSDVTYLQIATWLFCSWGSFLAWYCIVRAFAKVTSWICSQSRYMIKYKQFVKALTLRIVLLLWIAVTYGIMPLIFTHAAQWVMDTRQVFEYIMVACGIFLGQGIMLEFLSIRYIQGWLGPRSQRAFDELETIKNLQSLVIPYREGGTPGMVTRMYKSLFVAKAIDLLYDQISSGEGDDDKWSSYATILWNSIHDGKESLTRFDLDQRLRSMHRNPAIAYVLFAQLDASCDGNVTQEEVEKLVQRIGHQLNVRTRAQRGIDSLLFKLNIVLFVLMLIIVVILYFEIFQSSAATEFRMFFTSLSGISFAFGGILLEFINNLIFVFGKHPYDVGDYVEAKGKNLIVCKIALTYTNFEEASKPGSSDRGLVIQWSNSTLTAEGIVNWTRTAETVLDKKRIEKEEGEEKEKEEKEKEKEEKEEEKAEKKEMRELIVLKSKRLKGEQVKEEDGP